MKKQKVVVQEQNQSGTDAVVKTGKVKKPVYKKWWFWVLIVLALFVVIAIVGGSGSKEDLSKVAKQYTLSAGHYTVGVDLPAGTCDVTAVSGTGNLMSSNMSDGGVNEMFGIDDGTGLYTASFNGLKLPKDTVLTVTSKLVVQLDYSEITSSFSGRSYNDGAKVTVTAGNYTAGTDFPAGTYDIKAVSGNGSLSSSNLYDGGVNEIFGVGDGYFDVYNNEFINADFKDGDTLTVSGDLTVDLIPAQ